MASGRSRGKVAWLVGGLLCLAAITGCTGRRPPTVQAPMAPLPSPVIGKLNGPGVPVPTSNLEAAARVERVGRQLVAANPNLGLQLAFAVIGNPQAEIGHRGETMIDVSEGLVARCQTDDVLAAVLAMELAKIVSEREARESALRATPEREPPLETDIGPSNGAYSDPSPARMAELRRAGYLRRKTLAPCPVSDPHLLAAHVLANARFSDAALADAAAILRDAGRSR